MTHAWCHDTARDEDVRAAEDGRTEPLPTLEECIAMLPKSGSSTSTVDHENKGDDMGTKRDRQAADYRAEAAVAPAGLRTERVTLDVTHARASVATWDWTWVIAGPDTVDPESVRVVEDPLSDAWAQRRNRLTAERDAAIRERDALREQLESVACRAATAETALEAAQAASDGGEGGALTKKQRDAIHTAVSVLASVWNDGKQLYGEAIEALQSINFDAPKASGGGEVEAMASTLTTSEDQVLEALSAQTKQPGGCHHFLTNTDKAIIADIRKKLTSAPPQPRGWLKEEERACLEKMRDELKRLLLAMSSKTVIGQDTERDFIAIESILARSSPPEVVVPDMSVNNRCVGSEYCLGWTDADIDFRAAIAAAGVAVKEVG